VVRGLHPNSTEDAVGGFFGQLGRLTEVKIPVCLVLLAICCLPFESCLLLSAVSCLLSASCCLFCVISTVSTMRVCGWVWGRGGSGGEGGDFGLAGGACSCPFGTTFAAHRLNFTSSALFSDTCTCTRTHAHTHTRTHTHTHTYTHTHTHTQTHTYVHTTVGPIGAR
jgi:hypothetical protein